MYTFLLASTTPHGLQAAASLVAADFACRGVITPAPRPVGRHHRLTPSPVATWATDRHWPVFTIEHKITSDLQKKLPECDFLLVVDFGYYVPGWLINFPRQLAVNIHPSRLPAYRGASPGPAVILSGERESAVSLITLSTEMDAGDLLAQLPLSVDPRWTAADYYQAAFALASTHLPTIITDYAAGRLAPQPQRGPVSFAPKITKDQAALPAAALTDPAQAVSVDRFIRAYTPWPRAWTTVQTAAGPKRLQLLAAHLEADQLVLETVKLEGETAKPWASVRDRVWW